MNDTLFFGCKPLYVMAKPVGARCNLSCEYCYYLEKVNLYADKGENGVMSNELLKHFTREYIESQTLPDVLFQWHGGEPLMRPISFYKRAMELQRKYAHGRRISNVLQTNGTLLNDEWCRFFRDNGWLIGISIDGPQEFHDEFRRFRGGQPSWHKVMRGINLLNKWHVEWNAMAVINDFNADYPLDLYNFFKEIGAHYIQFTPIVERLTANGCGGHLATPSATNATLADFSVSPEQWGQFLCDLFDEWVREDVGKYFVQLFDATLANWVGQEPGVCSTAAQCGQSVCMEHNGDVYSCDHFVFPEYKLGNIRNSTLIEMAYGDKQKLFDNMKGNLPGQCRKCEWLFACHGECPKNRFATTADGESGLNYLCEGYRKFFKHVAPYMDFMKNEIDNRRSPANVMKADIKS